LTQDHTPVGSTPNAARRNIESIIRLEKEDEAELQPHHRLFHAVGWFVGTIYFVVFQFIAVGAWIAPSMLGAPHGWVFDEHPYPLLSIVLSFEAVLLTSCVLIRQNAIDRTSERRNHLELQINLLAEEEATKSLDLLQRIAERLEIPFDRDRKSIELANETPVDEIARDLRAREKLERERTK
jgi:uncharacterized membrane protein